MHEFGERFPGAEIVTLEENYRSTRPILDFANALIAASPMALAKQLTTSRADGEPPSLVRALDEHAQSGFVSDRVVSPRPGPSEHGVHAAA